MASTEDSRTCYLGRRYDPSDGTLSSDEVLYPLDDLTTHAVCIGMTGSGKTGLGIGLLEEAALDGIPSLVIDPKGDMTNLLLTFPSLAPSEFEPWVDADSARRRGLTVSDYASQVSAQWRAGLGEWGLDGARIARLKDSAEFVIYTPGSDAGLPVSVLRSLQAPDLSWKDAEDVLRELVASTVSALLALVGIEADPVHGREHIYLSHIVEDAWRRGKELDLVQLVSLIQRPPMVKLGVFDVDTFLPEQDRFRLAATFNNLIASPSFANWLHGDALDIGPILYGAGGKPRVAVFYLAHLGEAEQMFFVTLLLGQVLTWMHSLSGTPSLRALLYFDEVYGYVPPYPSNPPSKEPLMSLLKTARAFGLGLVLATQNPVDVDYKGLTNAGTWFIGKLQTDRDKARLLDGLEGANITGRKATQRSYLDRLIGGLDPRTFILHNVHADQPIVFKSRWTLSYLRGPLTPSQIDALMRPLKGSAAPRRAFTVVSQGALHGSLGVDQRLMAARGYSAVQPRVQARVPVFFFPADLSESRATRAVQAKAPRARTVAAQLLYEPFLFASVSVLYAGRSVGSADREHLACLAPLPELGGLVSWAEHVEPRPVPDDIAATPEEGALYAPLPPGMSGSAVYTRLRQELVGYIYRERALVSWVHPQLKLQSMAGESERDFGIRCQEEARRRRDQELERLEQKYTREAASLRDRLQREERELEQDEVEYRGRKRDEVLSAGESVVTLLLGRRSTRRVSRASVRRRLTSEARADVQESHDTIAYVQQRIQALQEDYDAHVEEIRARWADLAMKVQESRQRPRKSDILVDAFGLAWVPQWIIVSEDMAGKREEHFVPASKWLV